MSTENVEKKQEIDTDDFIPVKVKTKKRRNETRMEVDTVNKIEGNMKIDAARSIEGREQRKVPVPAHRCGPLKENWMKIFSPIVEHLKLQIRFNLKTGNVEVSSTTETEDAGNLQKAADFVKAFICGFEVEDALALLRLDDQFLETFEVQDVKPLKGDHLSRAIGRLTGKNGKTKHTIENATRTRIVLADSKIHILGSYQNIQVARRAICNLILGSPPSKVYGQLKLEADRVVSDIF